MLRIIQMPHVYLVRLFNTRPCVSSFVLVPYETVVVL